MSRGLEPPCWEDRLSWGWEPAAEKGDLDPTLGSRSWPRRERRQDRLRLPRPRPCSSPAGGAFG